MENYDVIVVDPPLYARAVAQVKRGDPQPIALAIFNSMSVLATTMHEQATECGICDYEFAVREPPSEYLCCVPVESDSQPLAMPICEQCANLSDAEKGARLKAALLRIPGARERKLN